MLIPRRTKYRKHMRGRMKGKATRGTEVTYGEYGLKALEPAWLTVNQIEAARVAIAPYTRRSGKLWIKVFADKAVTAKPAETRMGSGKGAPDHWVAVVRPNRVIFEVAGLSEATAKKALIRAAHKLPIKTKIIKKEKKGGEE